MVIKVKYGKAVRLWQDQMAGVVEREMLPGQIYPPIWSAAVRVAGSPALL